MKHKFDRKKYEEEIGKLTVDEARKALIREAELRFNAQLALLAISDELLVVSKKIHTKLYGQLDKMGINQPRTKAPR